MEKDELNGMRAEYAAQKIFQYATKKRMPHKKVVGGKYKVLCVIASLLPKRTRDHLLFEIYGGKGEKN